MMKANKVKFFTNLMGDFLKNLKTITTFNENKIFQKGKECMGASMRSVVVFTKLTILTVLLSFFKVGTIEAQCYPNMVFRGGYLLSGTALANNAVYRFPAVLPGVDANIRLVGRNSTSTTLINIDNTTGVDDAWQPSMNFNGTDGYIDWEVSFIKTSDGTAFTMPCFTVTTLDLDRTGGSGNEWIQTTGYSSFSTSSPTSLPAPVVTGVDVKASGLTSNLAGPSLATPNTSFQVNYNSLSTFTLRTGYTVTASNVPFSMYFGTTIFDPGRIANNQGTCLTSSFDPTTITSEAITTPSSGTQYKWVSSTTTNVYNPSGGWSDVTPTQTGTTYDPPPVSTTTYYVRLAKLTTATDWRPSNVVTAAIYGPNSPACGCDNMYTIGGPDVANYSARQLRVLNQTTGANGAALGTDLLVESYGMSLDTTYDRFYYAQWNVTNPIISYMDANGKQYVTGDSLPYTAEAYNRAGFNPVNRKNYFISSGGTVWASYAPTGSGVKGTVVKLNPITYYPASAPQISSTNAGGDIVFDAEGNGFILTNSGQFYKTIFNADNSVSVLHIGQIPLPINQIGSLAFSADGKLYLSGRGTGTAPAFSGVNVYSLNLETLVLHLQHWTMRVVAFLFITLIWLP
jgi:hypothetical protein